MLLVPAELHGLVATTLPSLSRLKSGARLDNHPEECRRRGEELFLGQDYWGPQAWAASGSGTDKNKLAWGRERSASTVSSAVRCVPPANNRAKRTFLGIYCILQPRCCICQPSTSKAGSLQS